MAQRDPVVCSGVGPLTTAQRQLWTGQQLAPRSPMYNMAVALTVKGVLDPAAFERAFVGLVDRCDTLRTTFEGSEGRVGRRVRPAGVGRLPYHDLSDRPTPENDLGTHLRKRTARVFALDGRLFDTALFRIGPKRHIWYLNQHHLITDAWSTALLVERQSELYLRERDGHDVVPALPSWPSYDEFVRIEADGAGTRHRQRAERFWGERQGSVAGGQTFYGRSGGSRSGRSRRQRLELGEARSRAIRQLAERPALRSLSRDLSLFHVFAAVLAAYLHRVGETDRPRIAAPSHNRGTPALRQTMGLLMELFPLSIPVRHDMSFLSLVQEVARANQERLVHAVTGTSDLAPRSEVVLNYIKGTMGPVADLETTVDWIHSGWVDADHAVRMQVYDFEGRGEFQVELDLSEDIFGDRELTWVVGHLQTLFDAYLENPDRAVGAPGLTSPGDRPTVIGAEVAIPDHSSVAR